MSGRVLKPGRNCFSINAVDGSGLLVDGRDYYRAFYHAAKKARKYIFISGWQFDSEVNLLRSGDLPDGQDTRFLKFLNSLCENNSELRIYILAWDFSLIFVLEREWMQEWVFNWTTSDRLFFQFDNRHAIGASQHQKYVVIDGAAAFLGGLDICSGRWDDRGHLYDNPERINPDGTVYEPYHDIQCYLTGQAVGELSRMFATRWKNITGASIEVPAPVKGVEYLGGAGLAIKSSSAALSKTQAKSLVPVAEPVREIAYLYTDAIRSARRLIFIENQYLSSFIVYRALAEKLEYSQSKLEVVIILPDKPHGLMEEISLGITQNRLLKSLQSTARDKGHALGVYSVQAPSDDGRPVSVYIHSKLMIVDDLFLTMGSANMTNRSMGLDTELNISWEATSHARHKDLRDSIRAIRADLLMEHTAVDRRYLKKFKRVEGLVGLLDSLAGRSRLRVHKLELSLPGEGLLASLGLDALILDPERALVEENLFEMFSPDKKSIFSDGITYLKKWLIGKKGEGFFL